MKKKWIVVAESCRARIFSVESRNSPLKEIDAVDQYSLMKNMAVLDDELPSGRSSMEARLDPKEVDALHFAQDLSEHLENARRTGDYNDLVIISSPNFLGKLKQCLGAVTHKCVSKTINKNLIHKREADIRRYLYA